MSFHPRFLATAIGSMPHTDATKAVDIVLASIPDAPIWPQLPRTGMNEGMEVQYSEGMPRVVIDRVKERMYFDTTGDYSEDLAAFYEQYIAAMDPDAGSGDCSALAISPKFAQGLYALRQRIDGMRPFVKVQTTGPISFALTTTDESKRAIYYNEEFLDMVVKALAMKCRWQVQLFKPFAERVICFIDEPILSAFGSSTYVSVTREDVVARLSEVVEAVHMDGGLAGVHCCGNTEWSILVDAGADIVNFDAFGYGETILMYPEAVRTLFERGGALAWGLVPTSTAVREQSVDSLVALYESLADRLAAKGIDKRLIAERAIVTPSCGTGSMDVADAERVFAMTRDLSAALKKTYGF